MLTQEQRLMLTPVMRIERGQCTASVEQLPKCMYCLDKAALAHEEVCFECLVILESMLLLHRTVGVPIC